MSSLILPRLDAIVARSIVNERWTLSVAAAHEKRATAHPRQKFASNGTRISEDALTKLGDDLRGAAGLRGFPVRPPTEQEAREWDADATRIVWTHLQSVPIAEAGRSDVWAFLCAIVCPDLVLWRYPTPAGEKIPSGLEARFLGGRRNLLKRFWVRGRAIEAAGGAWTILNDVREDDLVQIFERPSLSAVPGLAGQFLIQLASAKEGTSARDVLKRLNRELAITALYCFAQEDLNDLILTHMTNSYAATAQVKKKTR